MREPPTREPLTREPRGAREFPDAPDATAPAGAAPPPLVRPLVVLPHGSPAAARTPRARPRRSWRAPAVLLALAAITAWWRVESKVPGPARAAGAPLVLEIQSTGPLTTPVLVFGRDAGVHLVPARATGEGYRTTLPAAAGERDVWMLSLGPSPLFVRATRADDARAVRFTAHGRVVKAFETRSGTGVRTW